VLNTRIGHYRELSYEAVLANHERELVSAGSYAGDRKNIRESNIKACSSCDVSHDAVDHAVLGPENYVTPILPRGFKLDRGCTDLVRTGTDDCGRSRPRFRVYVYDEMQMDDPPAFTAFVRRLRKFIDDSRLIEAHRLWPERISCNAELFESPRSVIALSVN
jgi:hypothetical protein